MKILTLHSDYIKFAPTKQAIKDAPKVEKAEKEVKECLVVLSSVEKRDEKNPSAVAKRLVKEIKDIASQVKSDKIVLYPYVHLTNEPSNPKTAIQVLDEAEKELKKNFEVIKSPFGWYKSFTVACKGHPLAELSREFSHEAAAAKEEETESLKKERKLTSYWHILDTDGKIHDVGKFDYKGHERLKKFAFYEKEKSRIVKEEPAHVAIMKKLELVDYEPASDSGNLRYYPKGSLIKKLVEEYVTDKVIDYGGIEVETPIMYDMQHPTLSKYLARFPARQYQIESDKKSFFLRFSACFGQFLMAHDATLSYKNLPFKIYELTRYSFRKEQSGELTGLRRLRAFTMPDVHAIVADMKQAMDEYKIRFNLCLDTLNGAGIKKGDVELALRTTKKFFKDNKDYLLSMVKKFGKPVLLEMWDERIFYFVLKYELNFVDTLDKASALSTDQIDIENAERYDIKFMDKDGKLKHPLIMHCSPSGAVERVMYALLEKAAFDMKAGKTPMLPLWLSPTQVRIIPVSAQNHLGFAKKLADEIAGNDIRVDVDDNEESIGKRIRNAEKEWIPFILVVGDKEAKANQLVVRNRATGKEEKMTKANLIKLIKEKTKDLPFRKLPLPNLLSKRPVFVG
ncbi:threonine--tRNA ligase [Candidatus Woesearchaeota archaeon]|nr:threonine--tRNA ligase [Candidatus Woesearchaeota archaeon]